jgi:hypothetical protein
MKTRTITIHPILGCLQKAEDFLGKNRKWKPSVRGDNRKTQQDFINDILVSVSDVDKINEMKSIADLDVNVINKFLKDEGFNIKLSPIPNGEGFAVASVMKILVEWIEKGKSVDILTPNKKKYAGVQIDEENIKYHSSQFHSEPIASPAIKSKTDSVFITKINDKLLDVIEGGEFALLDWLKKVRRGLLSDFDSFSYLEFPCINYDQEVDISWLVGMNTISDRKSKFNGDPMLISEAKQQTKFRMNEVGAKVESAVAMGMLRCCVSMPKKVKVPLVIDEPFLLWMERSGVSIPYFAGIFDYDVWNKPQNLD